MNNKISTGIWLIFLGLVILLHNLDIMPFNFYAIVKFWPLALVSLGISLLLQNRPYGSIITAATNLLICIYLLVVGATSHHQRSDQGIDLRRETTHDGRYRKQVSTEYRETNTAAIEINGGATKYIVKSAADTTKLFQALTDSPNIHLKLDERTGNKLGLDMQIKGNISNTDVVELYLHPHPQWDIVFNVGAASVDGDFSGHRFKKFVISSGASSFKIKYGKPTDGISKIEINTAASNIKILLPKDVEYLVKSENVLSSTKINGNKRKGSGSYKTSNYNEATHKYYIEVTGAANSFSLDTYSE